MSTSRVTMTTRCTLVEYWTYVTCGRAMRPGDLAPTVFSTVGLPDTRRIELWETHNATALIGLDVHARDPLEATELNVGSPGSSSPG